MLDDPPNQEIPMTDYTKILTHEELLAEVRAEIACARRSADIWAGRAILDCAREWLRMATAARLLDEFHAACSRNGD